MIVLGTTTRYKKLSLTLTTMGCRFFFRMATSTYRVCIHLGQLNGKICCNERLHNVCSVIINIRFCPTDNFQFLRKYKLESDIDPHRSLRCIKFIKRSVMIRREICPIRAEISTHKHGEKLYISYLYD